MKTVFLVGVIIAMITITGIAGAVMTGDIVFHEHIDRPNNFVYDDREQTTGWIDFSHQSEAFAGGFTSMSVLKTVDVPNGFAPEEKSISDVSLSFFKNSQSIDPLVVEHLDTDITVGAANTAVVPTFTDKGDITSDPNERYDIMHANIGGFADANGGRGVSLQMLSSQDDWIHTYSGDSAGNEFPIITSYTDIVIPGMPGTSESQAYRKFNLLDERSWNPVVGNLNGEWNINTLIDYSMYNIPFNVGL